MNAVRDSQSSSSSSPSPSSLQVFDPKGTPLALGEKDVLGSGGEGTAYTLPFNPRFLVKVYSVSFAEKLH